ncbi:MAG: hypothetical protein GC164_08555 [Phycisphaera sp.]|nr:hypothetical protein [Phycisphaera sp.]
MLVDSLSEWLERYPVDRVLTQAVKRETRKANFGHYLLTYTVNKDGKTETMLGFVHGSKRK